MKKMLLVQNVRMTPQKPNKKSEKKRKKLRSKIFKISVSRNRSNMDAGTDNTVCSSDF